MFTIISVGLPVFSLWEPLGKIHNHFWPQCDISQMDSPTQEGSVKIQNVWKLSCQSDFVSDSEANMLALATCAEWYYSDWVTALHWCNARRRVLKEFNSNLESASGKPSHCSILGLHHSGHIDISAAGCINDVHNLWLPLCCGLGEARHRAVHMKQIKEYTNMYLHTDWLGGHKKSFHPFKASFWPKTSIYSVYIHTCMLHGAHHNFVFLSICHSSVLIPHEQGTYTSTAVTLVIKL